MKIFIMVEGRTEAAFKENLLEFLRTRFVEPGHLKKMPDLRFRPSHGSLPTGERLRRTVQNYLSGKDPADHVIWLTDVYTDPRNPGGGLWRTADEAKARARSWVGAGKNATLSPAARFHLTSLHGPHAPYRNSSFFRRSAEIMPGCLRMSESTVSSSPAAWTLTSN